MEKPREKDNQITFLIKKTRLYCFFVWRLLNKYGIYELLVKTIVAWCQGDLGDTLKRINGDRAYTQWAKHYDTLTDEQKAAIGQRVGQFEKRPLISVIMPVFNPPSKYLDEAIASVRRQLYPHWELCVADDCSTDPAIRQVLERHREADERIAVIYREENGHISRASNSALKLAHGDFVALMDHDDIIPEQALFWVVDTINRHANVELIYSDEDKIDEHGTRYAPYFKCDFNYELLLAQNMVCHLGVYGRDILNKIGGFRSGFEGSQDYDLTLRVIEQIHPSQIVHIPRVLYHWRAIEGSTARAPSEKNYAVEALRKAAAEHLQRRGLAAEVLPAPEAPNFFNRVRFARPAPPPMVSIIIPVAKRAGLLGMRIDSIIQRTTYPNYEIILVDNGNVEPSFLALCERLPKPCVRVVRDDSPVSFLQQLSLGIRKARGELFCLLSHDIEINTSDWLEEMVSFAVLPEIGLVGPQLLYPDCVQPAGRGIGIGGVAECAKQLQPGDGAYPMQQPPLHQAFSVLDGACLLIRREVIEAISGLDQACPANSSHGDFCLRVRKAGYRNVWTPYAKIKLPASDTGTT
jgi:glycosyltransferase involved in cell wall biosynthesis